MSEKLGERAKKEPGPALFYSLLVKKASVLEQMNEKAVRL
jgi:hypothetical protein